MYGYSLKQESTRYPHKGGHPVMNGLPLKFLLFIMRLELKTPRTSQIDFKSRMTTSLEAGETVPQKTPLTSIYRVHWDHVMVISHVSFIACSSRWLIPFARP